MSHPLARIRVPRENKQKSGFFRRGSEIQACEKGAGCLVRKDKGRRRSLDSLSSFPGAPFFEQPCLLFVCVGRTA